MHSSWPCFGLSTVIFQNYTGTENLSFIKEVRSKFCLEMNFWEDFLSANIKGATSTCEQDNLLRPWYWSAGQPNAFP